MVHDKLIYKERGMNDCLGKPFSAQELWRCLVKYFEPISWQEDDQTQRVKTENELQRKLINTFVKNNTHKFEEIKETISKGDIKTAHRLAHTLKGNAGQLNKILLQRAAKEVESLLKDGENLVTPALMNSLEIELAAVLAELTPLADIVVMGDVDYMNAEAATRLLDKLTPIISDSDPECLSYIDELRRIKESGELIRLLDDFDFKAAAAELVTLRGKL
jgi:HPt (histidine-containing phosphotransfer) domain-containing protein